MLSLEVSYERDIFNECFNKEILFWGQEGKEMLFLGLPTIYRKRFFFLCNAGEGVFVGGCGV